MLSSTGVVTVNPQIPVMLDDGFKGAGYWAANFTQDKNIVFDLYYYCFNGRPTGSNNVTAMICADAKRPPVDKFPCPRASGRWRRSITTRPPRAGPY